MNSIRQKFTESFISLAAAASALPAEEVRNMVTRPPDPAMGDVALPTFRLAKTLRKAPAAIAADLAESMEKSVADTGLDHIARIEAAGPYVNATFNKRALASEVLRSIHQEGDLHGHSDDGACRPVVVDFSSPNIAKPFSIGHLRSTVIGNAICNLHRALGYQVVGINHVGDWGKQFGMLAVAYNRELPESAHQLQEAAQRGEAILYLRDLYVKIHQEAEEDPSIHDQARAWFRGLEEGRPEEMGLWEKFKDLSIAEFNRVYGLLNVTFDHYRGESFYFQNGYVDRIVEELREAENKEGDPLLVQSRDAWIVDLEDEKMPPCLILKGDGATLYATRDIPAIVQRFEEFDPERIVYVVGAPQTLHFNQVFSVLRRLGYGEAAQRCVHVPFGLIKLKEGAMSTRKGNVVLLEDVLNRSVEKVKEIIRDRGDYAAEEKEQIARDVGIGAIIFADLSSARIKDWDFDWDLLLNFDGRTGPYLQYTHARMSSILRKSGLSIDGQVNLELLDDTESSNLVRTLAQFPEVVADAAAQFEPSVLSRYLLDLAETQNRFYSANRVLDDQDPETTRSRVFLVACARQVLANGLRLLGLVPVEKM